MVFNTRKTILQIQSLINDLVDSMDSDPDSPPKEGSGKRTTRKTEPGRFSSITIVSKSKINANVHVVVGEEYGVEIEIEDNLQDIIAVDVSKGKLTVISTEKYLSKEGLTVNIKTKSLENVTIEGAVIMDVKNFDNDTLSARIAGLVQLSVDGTVISGWVESSGSGHDLDLSRLESKEMDLTINGTGNARVNASEKLKVLINGTGNVRYKGDPSKISKKINGVGFVTPEN